MNGKVLGIILALSIFCGLYVAMNNNSGEIRMAEAAVMTQPQRQTESYVTPIRVPQSPVAPAPDFSRSAQMAEIDLQSIRTMTQNNADLDERIRQHYRDRAERQERISRESGRVTAILACYNAGYTSCE